MLILVGLVFLFLTVLAENNLTVSETTTHAYNNNTEEKKEMLANITAPIILRPVHEDQEKDQNQPRPIQTFGRLHTTAASIDVQKGFRPSQQVDTGYEFNRFPVEPAHPEAKHLVNEATGWTSKVRFPTHAPRPITVNDHPYPYLKEDYNVNYHTIPKNYQGGGGGGDGYQRPILHNWEMTSKRKPPSKTFYEEHSFNTEVSPSPWKKLFKLLTAFIPIGILLSALTPSIITIGPPNGTGRSGEKVSSSAHPLFVDDLNGCDERIFCELMLSAQETGGKQGGTQSIEAMLENYTQSNGNLTRLEMVYNAIKNGNCDRLVCNSLQSH